MKDHQKHSKSFIKNHTKSLPTLALYLLISLSIILTFYSLKSLYLFPSSSRNHDPSIRTSFVGPRSGPGPALPNPEPEPTELGHLIFGIGAAAKHWARRKEYVKYWWPGGNVTRGYVFLDRPVYPTQPDNPSDYPTLKVSGNTGQFPYSYRRGSRSALRITRIVSEMVRMVGESDDVRWFVMGDDDTVFFTDNLIRVLRKYDHTKKYYVGSNSETHMQNINFAYDMAFGGGGFAISYPLAKAIEKMQDRCIRRYAPLYGSDDRIHACLAELGVPLTKEPGFHQCDVHGNLFGLLAAHPVAPLVSLHHLDILDPIFPYMTPAQALTRLKTPSKLDSASLMQQSICYDKVRNWTISVSWGYAVQIIRGSITPREMQRPARTFFNWYKQDDPSGFSFNTRPFSHHPCQKPYVYYVNNAQIISPDTNVTRSDYLNHRIPHSYCWWEDESPEKIHRVEVYKTIDPHKWDEAPRRDCCRVQGTNNEHTMAIEVGKCGEDEVMEPFQ
ncbi:uncharacterized protein LOC141605091 [Silene latifolia]|uniref:uncharacterized protein LOC141605091 n=1 Tax=Silene latifolia TaxID=37657 RepID=UPI003D784B80